MKSSVAESAIDRNTKSLSVCWISGINDPGEWDPPPGVFTTVYVDVSCPNHDYD